VRVPRTDATVIAPAVTAVDAGAAAPEGDAPTASASVGHDGVGESGCSDGCAGAGAGAGTGAGLDASKEAGAGEM
jgi:hypothetical protein